MATNSKWNKETNPNGISQKLSTIQCLFLFKLFLWKCRIFTILVVLKGSRLKRLRYGIHNHLRYKMNFLHVPLHVPWEMSRIVDLQFKVRPCWLGHVGTQKPKKDKSFRKSPYNLLSPNICSIFFQHQVPHCHRSQDDFIMSLKIISDIFCRFAISYPSSSWSLTMYCQFAFHPPLRKSQYDATVLCFGSSVTIKWQPIQSETKKLIPTKFHKNSVQFNACFYSSSFFENAEFSPFWSSWKGRGWNAYDMAFTTIFATKWISFMFPFMYRGKCLGLWTYNLRSVHVDLDT